MRTTLDPHLIDPSANEPGLVVELRDARRALLFDLGEIDRLAPRVLLRASHAFVTHTHMDHFAGFDHWLMLAMGRVPRLVVWGGPRFVDQLDHKLRAYTWNVVHRYEVPLRIEAHSLEADGSRRHAVFDSRHGFGRSEETADPPHGSDVLVDEALFRVRACIVDHEMPVLAFAIEEKAQLRVAADRVRAMGLGTGPWLANLKAAVLANAPDDTPIELAWRDRDGEHVARRPVGELRALVLDAVAGRRIGYVTDLRFTEPNAEQLSRLLSDVDLLYIEARFLDVERDQAARKNHLTARQAGEWARRLRARRVVPFHFSPRYRGGEDELRAEVFAAWGGAPHASAITSP
ncbi:MBL fold metallo-hydrolase [Ideonella sp. DXS29W]|uniref:MBL fold metallo-hydrolase n=1 Tax=Ideonella lacteola TaxID=2984193 RepID=A0ABU9BSX0_9BURK